MVRQRNIKRIATALFATAVLGCSANRPPPAAEVKPPESDEHGTGPSGPAIEQEIGALDEVKVKQTFERASGKLHTCFATGENRLAFLAGEVEFVVRIEKNGSARWAFIKDSSLGDRSTEECMLAVLKATTWPKPVGGEGIAKNSFTFEPSADERPPVPWSPEKLGKALQGAKPVLSRCRADASTGVLKVTMYIGTDGKASAIGAASADERGDAAITCVIGTLQQLTFPSPGSYASKVSVTIE